LVFCMRMIFSENRYLFGIMRAHTAFSQPKWIG